MATLWAVLTLPLLVWGLPGGQYDALLFGGEPAWPAERFDVDRTLARLRDRASGADTDLNPLATRGEILDLTTDEGARAEVLRRYRLFSRQPDEMIIFRALQRMQPRKLDFDPQLYQYGGGYIYLIGATLAIGAVAGLIEITGDAGFYLEHPEAFARFYVAARLVSLVFGALALVAVHKLGRHAGGARCGWLAMLLVALCPVFITAVVEAKPHLPSACLVLWATLSGLDFCRTGRKWHALRMGLQAGCAFGLVLTGLVAALLWPALAWARRSWGWLLCSGALAIMVYIGTNPYVPYNWLFERGAVQSNIGNSTAMYAGQIERAHLGATRVAELLVEAAGWGVPLAGLLGLACLWRLRPRETTVVAASGLGMLLICVLLGAGKPAEYARFLILPVMLLCLAAAWLVVMLGRGKRVVSVVAGLLLVVTMRTPAYVQSIIVDVRGQNESRYLAGRYLSEAVGEDEAIGLLQEPAPYAVPPLDFAHRPVRLLPTAGVTRHGTLRLPMWLVFTADDPAVHAADWWQSYYKLKQQFPPAGTGLSRITWANKPVFIYHRAGR